MADYAQLFYSFFVSAINLTLAIVVYFRNPRLLVNRLFALSVFWVVLWTISNFLLHTFAGFEYGLFYGQLTFAMASLIPPTFLAFAQAFPADSRFPRTATVLSFAGIGVFFLAASFTSLIVTGASHDVYGLKLTYGALYPLFALYFVTCFATALHLLWRKYKTTRGIQRLRLRYLFLGTVLAVSGGVTTNLVMPLVFKTSRFSLFGPAFTVFVFGFVAHAILRHRLMDIRVVIRKGASYVISILVSGLALFAGSALAYLALNEQLPTTSFLIIVVVGMLVALAFRPLLRTSQALINRYVQRPSYDLNQTLQQVTRQLFSFLERDSLLASIADILHRTVRPEALAVYLLDGATLKPVLSEKLNPEQSTSVPLVDHLAPILEALETYREPLVRDEVLVRFNGNLGEQLVKHLSGFGWELILPVWSEHTLVGLIALGPKASGDPYFTPDIELLTTVSSQAGIVLANARLYEEVKTVKEHIEGILRNMESGVVAAARTGAITSVNAVAESLLGIRASELLGKPISQLPHVLSIPLRRALDYGETYYQDEAEFDDARGGRVSIVLSTSLLRDASNNILEAILVFTDHSRTKELANEKRRAERLAAFQMMARAIAHEIKNPLVAIKTFAELLPERFSDDDFRLEFGKVVVQEIERIDDLVARLRGLATPQALELKPLDLREPIEETLALLRGQLEHTRISVALLDNGGSPLVQGDKSQLKQLFLNLFINAIEAMSTGGGLSVRITSELANDSVLVEVSDTGPGFPENILTHIFDPFVTTKPQGSGLGLSICRGISDAHNATIRAHNNAYERGAIIDIRFPLAHSPRATTKV